MHPQILQTWPRGRQALAIRAHHLFQNKWKRNLFSQNKVDNDAKKNGLQDFYDIFICTCRRQDDQNWYSWSHEMRFKNLFLELVACDNRHADKYWIRPKMSALR